MTKNLKLDTKKVIDPPRYPKVIVPIENQAKQVFNASIEDLLIDLTKKIVEIKK